MEQMSVRIALVLLAAAFLASTSTMVAVSARYLPTRSQEDRLERLRELLKDLFDSDYDHRAYPLQEVPVIPEGAAIFKRSPPLPPYALGRSGHDFVVSRHGIPSSAGGGAPVMELAGGSGLVQIPGSMFDNSFGDSADRKVMK